MAKMLNFGLTGLLGLAVIPGGLAASETRLTETPTISGPSVHGNVKTSTPKVGGVIDANHGVKAQAGAPTAVAGHRTAPGSTPGAAVVPGAEGAAPNSGEQTLHGAVNQIQKERAEEAEGRGGDDLSAGSAIKKIFDGEIKERTSRIKMPESREAAVAGKVQDVHARVMQKLDIADKAPPENAAENYRAAIQVAKDAAASGALAARRAAAVERVILRHARAKANDFLTQLANGAYQAAAAAGVDVKAEGQVKRALEGFKQWGTLFKAPGRPPFIENADQLARDIQRVQEEAKAAPGKVSAPRVSFEPKGGSFFARLPPSSVVLVSKDLAARYSLTELKDAFLPPSWQKRALLDYRLNHSAASGFKLIYRANRVAGRGRAGSFFSAASYAAYSFFAGVWHAVRDVLLRVLGGRLAAAPSVNLNIKVVSSGPALALLEKKLSKEVEGVRMARGGPAAAAVKSDFGLFARIDEERRAALSLAARRAAVGAKQAREMLARAQETASLYKRLTGDGSGASAVGVLARRIEAAVRDLENGRDSRSPRRLTELTVPEDGASLRRLIDRMHASALAYLSASTREVPANLLLASGSKRLALLDLGDGETGPAVKAAARLFRDGRLRETDSAVAMGDQLWINSGGVQIYADILPTEQGGSVRLLVPARGDAEALSGSLGRLKFAVETREGALRAVLDADSASLGASGLAARLSRAVAVLRGSSAEPASAVKGESAAAVMAELSLRLERDPKSLREMGAAVKPGESAVEIGRFVSPQGLLSVKEQSENLSEGRTLVTDILEDQTGRVVGAQAKIKKAGIAPQLVTPSQVLSLGR